MTASQFWAKLGYNNIEEIGSTLSAPAQYAGNISWMAYSDSGDSCSLGPSDDHDFSGSAEDVDTSNAQAQPSLAAIV